GEVNKAVEITSEKVQKEWTCALCQLTISSKQVNSHLQGRKHKAKFQNLEASKQVDKNKGSSSSVASPEPKKTLDVGRPNYDSTKKQEQKVQANMTNEQCREKAVYNTWCGMDQSKFWCSICDVKLLSEIDLATHLGGMQHLSNTQQHMINAWAGGYYFDYGGR
ncbi:C2H2-type zinc finger protein, partial [Salmonella enterica subsp. enterica serovar Paratyphi A]